MDWNTAEHIACPACKGNEHIPLGKLGTKFWLACRWCGWEYAVKPEEIEEEGE